MEFKLKSMANVLAVPRIANVHFFDFPKGYATKLDSHPFYELIFVNSGALSVQSTLYSGVLQKDRLIIHPPDCQHALSCPKHTVTSCIIIGFACDSDALLPFGESPIALNETEIKQLAEIVKEGRGVFAPPYNVPVYDMVKRKDQPFGGEQALRALIETFLINLIRKREFLEGRKDQETHGFAIDEILQYLTINCLEKITINELAFLFCTNRSHLCRAVKEKTGKTVIEFIGEKKMALAKEKLLNRQKTVAQIADELHFEESSYFCRFFKKQTGVTPGEYRRAHGIDE